MSEQGYNPNQEPGNNLSMSAAGWNKVTSAVDEMSNGVPRGIRLTPQQKTTRETGRLVTEAKATEDIETGDWLNIVGVNIDSDANENYFKYGGCLPKVEKLDPNNLFGVTLAVALQPIKSGKYGRICLSGVCVANVEFPTSNAYEFYDDEDFTTAGAVKATHTDTGKKIHWHDQAAATSMAFVSLNMGGGTGGAMIPVDLVQVGGSQGNASVTASWTYDVFLASERGTGPTAILTGVDPSSTPHQWRRHTGQMQSATHGYAYKNVNNDYEIGWINEVIITAECP